VRAAAAQAQSARVKSALAQRDLSNATLRAPVGGVVTAILKHPGEAADPTSPVISIGPASTKQLTLTLSAADAAQVRIGNPVNFTVAGTNVSGHGRVSAISPVLDPATQTSTVVVSGLPLGTAAGSAIEASIDVAAVRGILVPQTAIVQDPQTSQTLVFVEKRDKDGKPVFAQRSVTVADHDDKTAVIASGLRPGERVAAQGAFALLAPSGGD
jgi:RND family efflux transporter MFP subunit